MNSLSYDDYFSIQHPFMESSSDDFHNTGMIFPHFPIFSNDTNNDEWMHDQFIPPLVPKEPQKKNKCSQDTSSFSGEHFVTRRTKFNPKDDFLPEVESELPEVILASPCKGNTHQSISPVQYSSSTSVTDNSIPLPDQNPYDDFEDALRKVKQMNLRHDRKTTEDIEYLEDLLAGLVQPLEISPPVVQSDKETVSPDLNSFNEISCNLNSQNGDVSNSQSTIRKLLEDDSFKGNFLQQKSTEILLKTNGPNSHLAEHDYCKRSKENLLKNYFYKSTVKDETVDSKPRSQTGKKCLHSVHESEKLLKSRVEHKSENPPKKPTALVQNTKSTSTMKNSLSAKPSESDTKVEHKIDDVSQKCCPDLQIQSNVPATNELVEPTITKKKISVEEYLKNRIKRKNTESRENLQCDEVSSSALDSNTKVPTENVKTEKPALLSCSNKLEDILSILQEAKAPSKPLSKAVSSVTCDKSQSLDRTNNKQPRTVRQGLESSEKSRLAAVEAKTKRPVNETNKIDKYGCISSSTSTPNENSQSSDSCDQYSSSGISSYHNSSVSSLCGSPFMVLDDKSTDAKYPANDRTKAKNNLVLKKSPFALNLDLLEKDRRSSNRKHNHRSKIHRTHSKTRSKRYHKNSPDSYDSDSDSNYSSSSEYRHSRKRYHSSVTYERSRSRTERSLSPRTRSRTERSLSPRTYRAYVGWNYGEVGVIPGAPFYYGEPTNMFYQPTPVWPPEYNYFHPYPANVKAPDYYDNRYLKKFSAPDAEKQNRVLFVGNIENGMTSEKFTERFKKFGRIENVKLHFKENGNNYGFVYYAHSENVYEAMKHGNDDFNLPQYSYGFGSRKYRTDEPVWGYSRGYPRPEFVSHGQQVDSFDLKLKQFQCELRRREINARPSKF